MINRNSEINTSDVDKLAAEIHLEREYPLSKLTTLGVGGPANWVAFCKSGREVIAAIRFCCRHGMDYFLMGGGSNVLAADKGFRGMIILNRIEDFRIEGDIVTCGAGVMLQRAVELTGAAGLAGMESLAGIPGTVGGAIAGNAGAYGCTIADSLVDVKLFHPDRGTYSEARENLGFRYRHSDLKNSGIAILSARFKLEPANADKLKEKMEQILAERWQKLPRENISAGCFFRNVEQENAPHGKLAAGELLEQIGAKQMAVGNAGVYPRHTNILINKGGATASELRELSQRLKRRVKETFDIDLTEEVIFLGDFS